MPLVKFCSPVLLVVVNVPATQGRLPRPFVLLQGSDLGILPLRIVWRCHQCTPGALLYSASLRISSHLVAPRHPRVAKVVT